MDGKVVKNVILILLIAGLSQAIPIDNRETEPVPSTASVATPTVVTTSTRPVEHRVEDIVIHAHEDDEIVSTKRDEPVYEREVDEVIVEPMNEGYVLIPTDDMEVAASGLVFRPLFRYRQQSRRRVDRNTRRRYPLSRPYYRY